MKDGKLFALLVGMTHLGFAVPAHAFETEVFAETAAQGYALRSPWGEPLIARRRFTQTLGLGLYELYGDGAKGAPDIFFRGRMRLDTDFGIADEELVYDAASNRFVPGLRQGQVDLMYGYLEGRRLAGGWLGFRLGRQYLVDSLGWWGFDGGLLRLTTPVYLQAELYGGFEERGGLPLSTPRFERNGIWRGNRTGFDDRVYPEFQEAELAPAYGISLESAGVTWIHVKLDYRKVHNQGESVVTVLPDPTTGTLVKESGTRTSSERAGGTLNLTAFDAFHVNAGAVYDFYNAVFSSYYGALDFHPSRELTIGAEYENYLPTFDADSIFNFFAHNPMQTAMGRAAWDMSDDFDLAASFGVRLFETEMKSDAFLVDWLGDAAARHRWSSGHAGVRGLFEVGDRGRRKGVDVYGEQRFLGDRWLGSARTSLYDFHDTLRPVGKLTSFAYMLGGGFRPSEDATIRLEWEQATNRLVGQRYRVLAMLDVRVR